MKKPKMEGGGSRPRILGTGLVALNVVVNIESKDLPRCCTGGTCGNVLTILSYLGWSSSPVSRLSQGPATDQLLADLRDENVSTKFVTVEADGSTPVIIHWISRNAAGEPSHSFSRRCPGCGSYLPGYKPVLASAAERLASRLGKPQVFFFDRVSRGALDLGQVKCRSRCLGRVRTVRNWGSEIVPRGLVLGPRNQVLT